MVGGQRASTAGRARQCVRNGSSYNNTRVLCTYSGFVSRGGQALMALGTSGQTASTVLLGRTKGRSQRGRQGRRVATTKMMFERFTEKAIKVVMLAQEEARRLGHNFVGTEQILLGLIGESTGAYGRLKSCIVTFGNNHGFGGMWMELQWAGEGC